jgi:hypothetical protein
MAEVTMEQLDQPEGRDRRRTVVIYKSAAAEAPSSPTADGSVPKEKLASHKNLMYSEREAELIEDLTRFLIEKQPSYVRMPALGQSILASRQFNQRRALFSLLTKPVPPLSLHLQSPHVRLLF